MVAREGNTEYLNFLEYVFDKNQQSGVPVSRETFFNVAQEFWKELEREMEYKGAEKVFRSFRSQYQNGRPSYSRDKKNK